MSRCGALAALALATAVAACAGPLVSTLPDAAEDEVRALARGCERERADACRDLGIALLDGQGVPADAEAGLALLRAGCQSGDEASCQASEELRLPDTTTEEVVELARRCDRRESDACRDLGARYLNGLYVDPDPDHALSLLRGPCYAGDWEACAHTEELRLGGDSAEQARDEARRCDRDDIEACRTLAGRYDTGDGVRPSVDDAMRILTDVCDADDAVGCYLLGRMVLREEPGSDGIRRANARIGQACDLGLDEACDDSESIQLGDADRSAVTDAQRCDAGDDGACLELGLRYRDGDGVDADIDRAVALIDRACNRGVHGACLTSARTLRQRGADGDAEAAIALLEQLCDNSLLSACIDVGEAYFQGVDVVGDRQVAYAAYRRACRLGHDEACGFLPGPLELQVPADAPSGLWLLARACDRHDPAACERLIDQAPDDLAEDASLRLCLTGDGERCQEMILPSPCSMRILDDDDRLLEERRVEIVDGRISTIATITESHGQWSREDEYVYDPDSGTFAGVRVRRRLQLGASARLLTDRTIGAFFEPTVERVYEDNALDRLDAALEDFRPNVRAMYSGEETFVDAGLSASVALDYGTVQWIFDGDGRPVQVTREGTAGSVESSYGYSAEGRLESIVDIAGATTTTYTFGIDEEGRLQRIETVIASDNGEGTTITEERDYDDGFLEDIDREVVVLELDEDGELDDDDYEVEIRFDRDDEGNPVEAEVEVDGDGTREVLYDYACYGIDELDD